MINISNVIAARDKLPVFKITRTSHDFVDYDLVINVACRIVLQALEVIFARTRFPLGILKYRFAERAVGDKPLGVKNGGNNVALGNGGAVDL